MSKRTILHVVAAALLLALPATAQEQVGAVAGRVVEADGGALPGATVELSSSASGTLVSTTDTQGRYRFPRVPPGVYDVKAQLEGFQPAETTAVSVDLGKTTGVNFELQAGEFTEEIVVTGERAQIDVTQSATSLSIAREQLEYVPRGRDFTDAVTQAPGVSRELFMGGQSLDGTAMGGISVDGASGSENRYVIDGMDSTNPDTGVQGQGLIAEFAEEVQVKSAGYNAEYGGSVGGVINVVTKSGTNEFHGSVGADYEDSSWSGDDRLTPTEDSQEVCGSDGLLCSLNEDDQTRLEPTFSLGGPIARNKAWFFVGYQRSTQDVERRPLDSTRVFDSETTREYFVGNIKGNVGSQFLYRVAANLSPRETEGVLPNKDGSTPAEADLTIDGDLPAESYSAYADLVPSSNFYASGRVGYYTIDNQATGADATSQIVFQQGSIPLPETDPRFQPAGFASVPNGSFFLNEQDKWERETAALDGNLFLSGAGEHEVKAGVQYELVSNEVNLGEINGNQYRVFWGVDARGVEGEFGAVQVRSFRTQGSAETENLGFYLQDSWKIRPNFTLNAGVRAEQEKIPNYPVNVPQFGEYAIEFDFDDKIAPRVGFAWDLLSDQRWKMYGGWGVYYDITKLQMPRGSFGADHWIAYTYPLNTLDWQNLPNGCHTSTNDSADNPCPQLGTPGDINDFRLPSNPAESIDPDLKPMEQSEWQLGLDHQLTPNIVLGARYVNKNLEETIEDIGFVVERPDGSTAEQFIIGNPGKGQVAGDPEGPLPPQAEAVREYQAVTLSFNRRLVDNWSLRANYTWSELEGNYSGLASSDEFGRTSPNVERFFDALHMAFDQNGSQVTGPLNTDRPHRVEVQALYRLKWGTMLGLSQFWAEGTPISEQVSFNGAPFFPHGRGNLGRTDDLTQTDLSITHPFQVGRYDLELSLNVLNLFDEDTVMRINNTPYDQDLCSAIPACIALPASEREEFFFANAPFDTDALMANAPADPQFGRPFGVLANGQVTAFQPPRSIRLGVNFKF